MSILPDILEHHLKVVFCGTAPGHVSARRGGYYANPGNRFWPTFAAQFLSFDPPYINRGI